MEGLNIKFVGEVEKYPVIYNYTLQGYSRKDITEKAWNEVAKEMNLPASECKEKWRNLRSTLAKALKPKPSGSGAKKKKPYYLTNAMQFAIPFIKVAGTSSGNLPTVPEQIVTSDEEPLDDLQLPSSTSLPPTTPTPRPPTVPPQTGLPSESTSEPAPSPAATGSEPKGRKRKRLDSPNDLDKEFMTYFRAKADQIKKKSSPNKNSVRRDGIQSFLNSLIVDLLPMTDAELRVFKRKTLLLVDEVLDARVLDHHGTPVRPAYQRTTPAEQHASYHVLSSHGSTSEESSVQSECPQTSPSPPNKEELMYTML